MTIEKAIKVLTELKGYEHKFALIGLDRKKALDMAIKAIEQQGHVWEIAYMNGYNKGYDKGYDDAKELYS